MTIADTLKTAHLRAVPLVAIISPDQPALVEGLARTNASLAGKPVPHIEWDIINGMVGINQAGKDAMLAVAKASPEGRNQKPESVAQWLREQTGNLAQALGDYAPTLPALSVIHVHNTQMYMDNPAVKQAILNLRDRFKRDQRMCILHAAELVLPVELQNDVLLFDEPLPDDAELATIIKRQFELVKLPEPSESVLTDAVDAGRGLSKFVVEQVTIMSLSRQGLDMESLWRRKCAAIEQVPGLSIYRGNDSLDALGGCHSIVDFASRLADQFNVFLFMDEVEKMLGGAGTSGIGDSSGVTQDQLGVVLRSMEDYRWPGMLLLGPPGVSKTHFVKCLAGSKRKKVVIFDLGAMKGSFVGQSEQRIRTAVRVCRALGGEGKVLVFATCNRMEALPPELLRRFKLGRWYFDLPWPDERAAIWPIHMRAFGLAEQPLPEDRGWTGANIRDCCEIASRLRGSLREAARFVVPLVASDPEAVERLRTLANNRFLSAAYPGVYLIDKVPTTAPTAERRIALSEEEQA